MRKPPASCILQVADQSSLQDLHNSCLCDTRFTVLLHSITYLRRKGFE